MKKPTKPLGKEVTLKKGDIIEAIVNKRPLFTIDWILANHRYKVINTTKNFVEIKDLETNIYHSIPKRISLTGITSSFKRSKEFPKKNNKYYNKETLQAIDEYDKVKRKKQKKIKL